MTTIDKDRGTNVGIESQNKSLNYGKHSFYTSPGIMPSVSTLFLISIPTLVLALIWQLGLPDVEHIGQIIQNDPRIKELVSQFTVQTHCYESVKTLSPNFTNVDCFKVSDGRFRDVFLDDTPLDMRALERPRSGHVIPGLWDGHGHLIQYGESLGSVNIFGAKSMKEVQNRLVAYKADRPEAGSSENWLRGVGWDQANFGGQWPVSVGVILVFGLADGRVKLIHVSPTSRSMTYLKICM